MPPFKAPPPTRSCGDCTLCCKLLRVGEIDKPANVWCAHCDSGKGCTIYASRPAACIDFNCSWLMEPNLGDEWRPKISKIVLQRAPGANSLVAHVDPQRPTAWKQEPYHSALRAWSRAGADRLFQVIVAVGGHLHAILPDRDVDLGVPGNDQTVALERVQTPQGPRLNARVVQKTDVAP